jgi:hypothetical protein
MKVLISSLMIAAAVATLIRAQEKSASPAEKTYPEVPKEYEVGEDTISPDGRFAILYPVRDDDSNSDSMLPNLLVRLKPYAVLKELETGDDARRTPLVGLVCALPKRPSKWTQSGRGSRRRQPLHGRGPSCSCSMSL